MDPIRWQQIDKLLDEALDRQPEARKAFLEQACVGDEDLRLQVEALLAAHEKAGSFVETPALDLAAQGLARAGSESFVGKRLGPYEVLSLLGRGGMGEVYRARDTRLDRMDALKILPPEVASDFDRLRRFIREAKAASALNHPNIATIYEIGQSDGVHWIAMELVEGQTLGERIQGRDYPSPGAPRHPLPQGGRGHELGEYSLAPERGRGSQGEGLNLNETLDIGIQAAAALEEAHSKGITHRDIKPANLMLTSKGQVKVLDFGLAKRIDSEGVSQSTASQTTPGLVMGTARYMSPEQVLGQPVDHRTDIFSLGVVLYEMTVGQPPFAGETSTAIFDAIVHQTPIWPARIQARVPEELRRIIQKALEKFREMRFQTAAELYADLEHLKGDLEAKRSIAQPEAFVGPGLPGQIVSRKMKWILAPAGMLGLALAVMATLWFARMPVPETPLMAVPLTSYAGTEYVASFSPDGSQVAFTWNGDKEDNWDIYVKLIGSEPPLRLTTNKADDAYPAWSPDGRQIAFCRDIGAGKGAVVLISPLGGPERILTEFHLADGGPILSWSPDGRALAMVEKVNGETATNLVLYMMETGEKCPLTKTTKTFLADGCPAFSPDGRTLAFCRSIEYGNSDLYLLGLSRDLKPVGEPRRLTFQNLSASGAAWSSDGSALVYCVGGNLWRVAASRSSQPQKMASLGQDAGQPAISRRGARLAYTHWTFDNNIWRRKIPSSQGKHYPPTKFISSTRDERDPQYSPDGKRIAFTSDRSGSLEIWICDVDGSNAIQLSHFGKGITGDPQWSPDSSRLTFNSKAEGHFEVYVMNASGGNPRRLTSSSFASQNPSWARDGRWIFFDVSGKDGVIQICKVPAEGGPAVLVINNSRGVWAPVESPDGKFMYAIGGNVEGMTLVRAPLEGGEFKQILDSLYNYRSYVVAEKGIYFIPRPDQTRGSSIRFLEFATGKITTIAELGKQPCGDWLTVSPDRRWALYTQTDQLGSDLMLVENFH